MLQVIQPGLGGADGWLGFDSGADFRGGFRHASHPRRVSGGRGGIAWGGHLHGLCRGAIGRRLANRPRADLWCAGWSPGLMTAAGGFGHTLPFLDLQFPRGFCRGGHRGRHGIGDHQLGAPPLHGYAAAFFRLPGGGRGRAGVRGGYPDRQFVSGPQRSCERLSAGSLRIFCDSRWTCPLTLRIRYSHAPGQILTGRKQMAKKAKKSAKKAAKPAAGQALLSPKS